MFSQKTTTIRTYHLSKKNFQRMREIFCKWTNNGYDDIKNVFSAQELYEIRSEFFKAVSAHLIDTQKVLDEIQSDTQDNKRVIKALIDKTIDLEDDCQEFDTLTDYDGAR